MPKTRYFFFIISRYFRHSVGGSAPKPPLVRRPDPVLLFSFTVATFYKRLVLMLTRFIIVLKEQMRLVSDF